jgi:predicted outer membrane repeat protein
LASALPSRRRRDRRDRPGPAHRQRGTFTGNTAEDGGAIFSDAIPCAPQITAATFVRNTATGDGGADIGLGGAIANYSLAAGVIVNGSVTRERNPQQSKIVS